MASPRHLLFITAYSGMGGGERIQLELMGALDRTRYVPHLVLPREGLFAQMAREAGVVVHLLPFRGVTTVFWPPLWGRFPVVSRLAALLRDARIDAVISDYHALPFAAAAARRVGAPVLWLLQGWWFPVFPWQRSFFHRTVTHAFALSSAVRDGWLRRARMSAPGKISVLHPGVDPDHFHPDVDPAPIRAQLGIGPDAPLVALLARFQYVKGHDTFQDMARLVLDEIPAARFVVAGDNVFDVRRDGAYKRRIRARWEGDPALRAAITYLGHADDPRPVIAAADVVVCPSRFESLGMVHLETMAMARPIVSTDRGGPAETVLDGVTGVLVPPGDPAALAGPVVELLRDPERRARMGAAGRAHVLANFTAERYAAQVADLVDGVMQDRGG